MRDLLVLGIFMGALPFALRHTWAGVLLWTWISIMNPHQLAYGFAATAPFAAVAAGATLISIFLNRDKLRMPWEPPVVVLFMFVFWMCVTTVFAFHPQTSWDQLVKVLKIQLMTVVAFAAIRERKHIELFIWINVLSLGFFGVKGGLYTIATAGAGRVWGPGGFIGGNNELAVALIMAIPLMNYLRMVSTRRWVRIGLLVALLLTTVSALGTQSRGAFLAISAMALVLWFRSDRKFVTGVMVAIVAVGLVAFLPNTWEERMGTIQSYEQDGSAMGRIEAWKMTFNLASKNFFGGGFDIYYPSTYAIYAPESTQSQGSHSIYFSVLGEHGFVGLVLFLTIWYLAFRTAGNIRRDAKRQEETAWLFHLAGMCQVSLVGYLVGGAFLALAYFDLPYNVLVILVASLRWMQEKRWVTEPTGAFGSGNPVSRIRTAVRRRIQRWS